jgi:serine/threonine protein kinase
MSTKPLSVSGNLPVPDPLVRPAERAAFRHQLRRQWSEAADAPAQVAEQSATPEVPPDRPGRRKTRSGRSSTEKVVAGSRGSSRTQDVETTGEHPDFELLGEIGRDDVSSLHEGFERSLQRYVTVRKLLPELRGETAIEEVFWNQARGGAGLQHEHIQGIYSMDVPRRWVVLEPFDHTLAARLGKTGAVPPQEVQQFVEQALRGLAYLHGRGQIHGGIHPGTLLINKENQLKLTRTPGLDAKAELRLPPGGARYLAPELLAPQMFGKVGPACDLYALGLTALELLTGPRFVRLFKGIQGKTETGDSWARWHCSPTERLPSVATLARGIPDELARVLDRMLEKRVADRYPSAQEALADLGAGKGPTALIRAGESPEMTSNLPVVRSGSATHVQLSVPPSLLPGMAPHSRIKLPEFPHGGESPPPPWKQLLRSPKSLMQVALGGVALLFLATLVLSDSPPSEPPVVAPEGTGAGLAVREDPDIRDVMPEDRFPSREPPLMAMAMYDEPTPAPVPEPPAAPPEPPEPTEVPVVLNSIPDGAQIEVDGLKQEDRTPATLQLLPGSYQVTLRLAHHQTVRETIEVTDERSKPFEFALAAHAPPAVDVPRIAAPAGGPRGEAATLLRSWLVDRWIEFRTFSTSEQEVVWKQHSRIALTDPRLPHALALLVLFDKQGSGLIDNSPRLRRAIQLLEQADTLSPSPHYILHLRRLAWCQLQLGRHDEALQACRRMLTRSKQSGDEALHREAVRFSAAVLVFAEQAKGLERSAKSWLLNEVQPNLHKTFAHDVEDFQQQYREGDRVSRILPEPLALERDLLLQTAASPAAPSGAAAASRPQETAGQAGSRRQPGNPAP